MNIKLLFWTIALFLIPLFASAAADLTSNLTIYLEFNNDDVGEIDGDNIRDVSIDINTVNNTEIDGIAKGEALSNNSIVKLGARSYYLSEDTQDYIEILDNATLEFGQELTACLWIFPKAVVADTALIMKTFDPTDEWGFLADTSGQISYRFTGPATGYTANGIVKVDSWQLVCMVYNGSETGNTRVEIWHNNTNRSLTVNVGTVPATITNTANDIIVGWWKNLAGRYLTGYVDGLAIWKRTLGVDDLADYWNGGVGKEITGGTPSSAVFTITARDIFNLTSLDAFTVSVFNTTENYTNTTSKASISFGNLSGIYNVSVRSITQAGGYFERIYNKVNVSNNLIAELWQAIAYINASNIIDGTKINDFGARTGATLNISNSTGYARLLLNAKSHNIAGNASSYASTIQNLSLSALEERYFTLEFGRNMLSINASDILSNLSISSFTVNVIGLNVTYDRTLSTSSGQINFSMSNGNYSLTISGSTIARAYANITVDVSIKNYTFSVFSINSIYIQTFKEGTSTLLASSITANTSVKASFDSLVSVFSLNTTNGTIYAENVLPAAYTITMSSVGYTSRDYFITLESGANIFLNTYLINSTGTNQADITFVFKDSSTTLLLPNITVSVSEKINLSYITIDQKISDVVGEAVFSLDQTKTYRFTLNKNGYQPKIFDLKPVSTAYTITMDKSIIADWSTIYSKVSFLTLPSSTSISTGHAVNFSIITTSLGGAVQDYFGLNTTYLGINYLTNVSGSPSGGTASIVLNLSNTSTATIPITYFIKVNGRDKDVIDRVFYLSNLTSTNASIMGFKENLENNVNSGYLALIAVFGTILIMGTFWSIGIKGNKLSIIAAMSIGIFTYFGFIHPDSMLNNVIGSIITITLMGSYFILNRIGD